MKYLFYAIVFDIAGNTTVVGSSTSPAKAITTNIQKVTGISINPSSAQTKNIGDTFKITATVSPSDANNKGVNWSSSNSSVATVDSSGNVRCVSAGEATITATASDGSGKSASLSLTVRDPLTSLTLDKTQTTLLYGGATTTVTASTTPSDYDVNNLTWSIGDTSLATISGTGKTRTITSNNTKKTGETTLTVSGGGKTATMKVSIVNFQTTTYSYKGIIETINLPAGTYKFECWGASSCPVNGNASYAGHGAYSISYYTFNEKTSIKILVGGQGTESVNKTAGGGGGGTFIATNSNIPICVAGGGGAHDINPSSSSVYTVKTYSNGQSTRKGGSINSRLGTEGYGGDVWNTSNNSGAGGGGFYGNGSQGHAGTSNYWNGGIGFITGGAIVAGGIVSNSGGFGGGGPGYGNGGRRWSVVVDILVELVEKILVMRMVVVEAHIT